MRDWARSSPQAARVVRRVDNRRIELIQRIFIDLGYDEPEAFVRARVTYFHQVGYYALGLGETKARRTGAPAALRSGADRCDAEQKGLAGGQFEGTNGSGALAACNLSSGRHTWEMEEP